MTLRIVSHGQDFVFSYVTSVWFCFFTVRNAINLGAFSNGQTVVPLCPEGSAWNNADIKVFLIDK